MVVKHGRSGKCKLQMKYLRKVLNITNIVLRIGRAETSQLVGSFWENGQYKISKEVCGRLEYKELVSITRTVRILRFHHSLSRKRPKWWPTASPEEQRPPPGTYSGPTGNVSKPHVGFRWDYIAPCAIYLSSTFTHMHTHIPRNARKGFPISPTFHGFQFLEIHPEGQGLQNTHHFLLLPCLLLRSLSVSKLFAVNHRLFSGARVMAIYKLLGSETWCSRRT